MSLRHLEREFHAMKNLSTRFTPASLPGLVVVSAVVVFLLASVANPYASAQEGFGPIDATLPAGLTSQQIVDKFAARESVFDVARRNYTWQRSVKVDTINDDTNKVDGEYYEVTDIVFGEDGKRAEHVVFAPQNTLQRVMMSPADFQDIEHRLPFILTTEDLPQYDITYVGRQHVDEIDTYVFDAKPKVIEKNHRYFQGRVWVDQQDFQIVLVNGKNVPDDLRKGHEDLSPPFTTYYGQVDGKYWFPIYTKAEGILHFGLEGGGDVHLRSVVKYTDYKQFHTSSRIIYNGQDITNNKTPDDSGKQTK
ncbi:hypothetical protein [Edaphobacter acidisoli]|uniref:hypothetical protein n=2 Tax=Edaphobacter acidisoli TaxID=2040573 RepID=UPI001E55A330|nr:hypothetical protein [Edaphobacter acidisoli]